MPVIIRDFIGHRGTIRHWAVCNDGAVLLDGQIVIDESGHMPMGRYYWADWVVLQANELKSEWSDLKLREGPREYQGIESGKAKEAKQLFRPSHWHENHDPIPAGKKALVRNRVKEYAVMTVCPIGCQWTEIPE